MGILEIIFIGVGLAMDAFAVSICKGLSIKKLSIKSIIIIGLYFGIFQAIMPLIGYFLGVGFEDFVVQIDHWIAFFLLLFIGINMIREVFKEDEEEVNDDISFKTMIILGIATSIDALACRNNFCIFTSKYMVCCNFNRCYNFCYISYGSYNSEINLEISLRRKQNCLEELF